MEETIRAHTRCHLLERLPSELRLLIYEHVYKDTIHRILYLTSTLRVLRARIPTVGYTRNYRALIQTCKTIYREALSCLYGSLKFSMIGYTLSRERNYDVIGSLDSSTFLRFVRRIHLQFWDVNLRTINVFLLQLRGLADAFNGNDDLETCTVRFHPPIGLVDPETAKAVRVWCEQTTGQCCKATTATELLYLKVLDEVKSVNS